MLPQGRLSTINILSPLIGGRANSILPNIDYEDGPIALENSSQGLKAQIWRGQVTDLGVFLEDAGGNRFDVLSELNITEMSFTFDQNAKPIIVYVQYAQIKLWWFDTTVNSRVTTNFGAGILSPKVFLDDKRPMSSSSSDIILGYIKNKNLYYRQQRDRYQVEYLLATDVGGSLKKIGMGSNLRLQFVTANY